jgi:TPR repeat protein
MSRIAWTLFGMTLAMLLALGGYALELLPGAASAGQPRVVVTMDSEAQALDEQLSKMSAKGDRLSADLAAMEADRKAVMEDLADVMAERDKLRLQLADAERRLEVAGRAGLLETETAAPAQPAPAQPASAQPAPETAAPRLVSAPEPEAAAADGQPEAGSDEVIVPQAGPVVPPPPAEVQTAARAASPEAGELLSLGLKAYREEDYRGAFDTWLPLARAGNPRAQFFVGGLYSEGRGVPRNLAKAYVWLKRSGRGGYYRAGPLLERVTAQMDPAQLAAAENSLSR